LGQNDRDRDRLSPKTAKSRMRESRTYGSVWGALSNERPYRDTLTLAARRAKKSAKAGPVNPRAEAALAIA
jgi:hypothetical protein